MAVDCCVMEEAIGPPRQSSASKTPSPRGSSRRSVWRCVRIPLAVYLGLTAVLFALQNDLIFPGSKRQGQADTVVKPLPDEQLINLATAQGDRVVALFGPALTAEGKALPEAARRPTLLYFYGNAMSLSDAVDQLEHFRRLGVNVMIPDYVGFGMSGGKASETGCQATADAALAYLRKRPDVDPKTIVAAGWSLGGAVAIDLASREKLAGLISFCTFTSMSEMAKRNMPFLPTSLLLRHRFDSQSKIARVSCPILIGHGRRDDLIPHSMAERLIASARAPVMKFTIENAGHNDFFAEGGPQVLQAMKTFLDQLTPGN